MPSVVVMNLSYTGLGLARALAGNGIRIVGIGSNKRAYGRFSRHLIFLHSPDSLTQRDELCQFLIALARKEPCRPLIFPTRDHDVIFLRDYREQLEQFFIYTQPPTAVLDMVLNKWTMHFIAQKLQIKVPQTFLIENRNQMEAFSSTINYPALLKPVYASDWRREGIWDSCGRQKAILGRSPEALCQAYQKIEALAPRVLLQEFIEGEETDIYTYCSYCNRDSEIIASFNTRKVRQVPEMIGTGIVVQSAENSELSERSEKLLKHIAYYGISEIEYKRDPRTGEYYLIEINPRFWDQHRLSTCIGLNLPLVVYNDLTGLDSKETLRRFCRYTWIAEDAFFYVLLYNLFYRRRDVLRLIAQSRGRKCYATWSLSDPMPFIALLVSMILGNAGRAGRAIKEHSRAVIRNASLSWCRGAGTIGNEVRRNGTCSKSGKARTSWLSLRWFSGSTEHPRRFPEG